MTALRQTTDGMIIPALQSWFGISPHRARVLWVMYCSPGFVSYGELSRRSGCKRSSIACYVSQLRAALNQESFLATGKQHRLGLAPAYHLGLSDQGCAEVRHALAEMYAELGEVVNGPQRLTA